MKRLIGFDYLRGLSCLLVILYHYTARYDELFGFNIKPVLTFEMGYMGVATFFILSGYLTIYNLDERISVKNFLQKKFFRLYPCYWLCLLITFCVTRMALPERAISPIEALLNMTMLQSFLGIKLVDGAYWTLACELLFYFFVLISVVIMKKKSIMPVISFLLVSLLFISYFFDFQFLFKILKKFLIDGYGYMFISGMMIYYINLNSHRFCSITTILVCSVVQYFSHNLTYFMFFSGNILVVILLAAGRIDICKEITFVSKLLQPLLFVSNISYVLYLLHQNIGYVMINFLYNMGVNTDFSILITLITVVLFAYYIDYFILRLQRRNIFV